MQSSNDGQSNAIARQSHPSRCTIIRTALREIIKVLLSAMFITVGALPVAMIFRLNPYLSNELYIQHPQETTKKLLMSAVSCYFFLQSIVDFPRMAGFVEGRFDLKGKIITAKQALIIFAAKKWMPVHIVLAVIAYPCVFSLLLSILTWDTFKSSNLHLLCATLVFFFNSWLISYYSISVLYSQTIRDKKKALSDEDIYFMKYGVLVKRGSKKKRYVYQRVKISFLMVFPFLILSIFMALVAGGTRYFLKQSKILAVIFCIFIMILKTILQHWLRHFLLKHNAKATSYIDFAAIAGLSVVFDCPVRFIFSQAETSVDFLVVTTGMALFEVCMRCTSVLQVIKLLKKSPKCVESSTTKNKRKNTLRTQQRILKEATLIMLKVKADMTSEYVAINLSFIVNCLFGHYVGFVVGQRSGIDVLKLISYLAWQYLLEFIVDVLSFSLESYHPMIRNVMTEKISPSRLGLIVVNFTVGMYSMLILVLLVVR